MRIVFFAIEEFIAWATDHCTPEKYETYWTPDEIVIAPTKSTRPLLYAYLRLPRDVEGGKTLTTTLKNLGLRSYVVDRIEWDVERKPGIEARIE